MLTRRGWWLFMANGVLLVVALLFASQPGLLVAFSLLFWFLAQWLLFRVRWLRLQQNLVVERTLLRNGIPVDVAWARSELEVRVRLQPAANVRLPYVLAVDRVPILARWKEGEPWAEGMLSRERPLEVAYRVHCPSAGQLRFDGIKVQIADLQGLFAGTFFARDLKTIRVLPAVFARASGVAARKSHNLIPLMGTHRHRRPGNGTELLHLREYVAGDPPRTIAWKSSARRDRLMTKEFESEVPVRCTLFVDVSSATRVGPPGENALARLIEIAATLVHTANERRDLVGLGLIDDERVRALLPPARGPRAKLDRLRVLSDAADLPPASEDVPLDTLVPYGMSLAQDLYPELLDPEVNRIPFWSFRLRNPLRRWRKRLASVLSVRHGLGPGGMPLLLDDDEAMRRHVVRFLGDHQVACPIPLFDAKGRYRFRSPSKMQVLSAALARSVALGKDNELFVLLVDLFDVDLAEKPEAFESFLRSIRMAQARRHQVMVILPWPANVPGPGEKASEPDFVATLQEWLHHASEVRLRQSYERLRQALAKVGVAPIVAPQEQAVPLILYRMERLRAGR
jgi:uncharacterized protein (DUF58 family)